MVTYNLNEQNEKAVIDYAAAHGKAILVKKALASGHVCLSPGVDPVRASFELLFDSSRRCQCYCRHDQSAAPRP